MNKPMSFPVFDQTNLAGIPMKNRLIRSATHEAMGTDSGKPSQALFKKYEALAKGGVGAIITGYAGISQQGRSPLGHMLMIDSDDLIPAYRDLVDRIHALDTALILQIAHCGRQTSKSATGQVVVAPSAIRDKIYSDQIPKELSTEDIHEIIDQFVQAIHRAKEAGFDGVQLHGAHGYLLSSFLSPHMNRRKDQWGGSVENNFRIISEIVAKARKQVGDYPILLKLNGHEISKRGVDSRRSVAYAQLAQACGISAIEVSAGIMEEGLVTARGQIPYDVLFQTNAALSRVPRLLRKPIRPLVTKRLGNPQPHRRFNQPYAKAIKDTLTIPVIVVGGIRSLEDIEVILSTGSADFVSMSKPFILEPNLAQKFQEGKQVKAKCMDCNICLLKHDGSPLRCYYGTYKRP